MTERTAIVIGGGIGGLAVAAGLSSTGWRVTVLEQAPKFAPVGAGIALAPNAVRALDWLGVGKALRERSVATGPAGVRTASGRWLLRTSLDALVARFGVPVYALHRADLHRMLLDAAREADIRLGHRVTGVRSGPAGAEVEHEAGTERADLVVAADGVYSAARAALFPDHPGPAYAGYLTWRGIVPAEAAPPRLPGITESWGRGERFGLAPLADGRVYWFGGIVTPEWDHLDDDLKEVAARFAGWHEPIPQLLATTPPEALLSHDIYHLATPLPSYVVDRVVLLGDAAHAMTPDLGQGACQALEDAVTLTALTATDDLPAALAAYDRTRRPRTQALVRASDRAGRLAKGRHRLTAGLRNAVAWALPASVQLSVTAGTLGWQPPARRYR